MSCSGSPGDGPKPENKSEGTSTTDGNKRTTLAVSILHIKMCRAAFEGDWQSAQIFLQSNPELVRQKITGKGDTALHVAAAAKQTEFVRELVKQMEPNDLLLENNFGYTAFSYAAASGKVEIAYVMREKVGSLVTTCKKGLLKNPIYIAASLGHTDMVSYLYNQLNPLATLSEQEQFKLLLAIIEKNMYDIALKILTNDNPLATMKKGKIESLLRRLAQHDISNICTRREASLKSLVSMSAALPCLSWLKRICEQRLMQKRAWSLAKKLWQVILKLEPKDKFNKLKSTNPRILHDAAKVGNVEFITMLASSYPDIIYTRDDEEHTMFHIAVIERQENVFRLLHQIGAMKDWIAMGKCDKQGNNILHLAGNIARPNRLTIVAGPALQMQRELMWFKEVEKIVPSSCRNVKNKKRHSPRELFTQSHKELLAEGEKWMKDTANYCMITATLIATIVFAASITVPGGNNGDTGSPTLLKRSFFTVFMVSDMAAMFFSTFSIIMFLSILTSRFQEDDFLVSLPGKLIFGLAGLFLSVVGIICAFTSTCFLLFAEKSAWIAISVAAFACFLLTFIFVRLHFKLWIDTVRLTYFSGFLLRPSKHSLFSGAVSIASPEEYIELPRPST